MEKLLLVGYAWCWIFLYFMISFLKIGYSGHIEIGLVGIAIGLSWLGMYGGSLMRISAHISTHTHTTHTHTSHTRHTHTYIYPHTHTHTSARGPHNIFNDFHLTILYRTEYSMPSFSFREFRQKYLGSIWNRIMACGVHNRCSVNFAFPLVLSMAFLFLLLPCIFWWWWLSLMSITASLSAWRAGLPPAAFNSSWLTLGSVFMLCYS